jgi:hypothetical protein
MFARTRVKICIDIHSTYKRERKKNKRIREIEKGINKRKKERRRSIKSKFHTDLTDRKRNCIDRKKSFRQRGKTEDSK